MLVLNYTDSAHHIYINEDRFKRMVHRWHIHIKTNTTTYKDELAMLFLYKCESVALFNVLITATITSDNIYHTNTIICFNAK